MFGWVWLALCFCLLYCVVWVLSVDVSVFSVWDLLLCCFVWVGLELACTLVI